MIINVKFKKKRMLSITLESDLFGETAKALLLDFPEWSE